MEFKNIHIVARPNIDDNTKVKVLMNEMFNQAKMYDIPIIVREDINEDTLVISIGGDGTFLAAARTAYSKGATVTGFNLGRKGFLVDNDPLEVMTFFAHLKTEFEEHEINERSVLELDGNIAINEFLVSPTVAGLSLSTSAYVNGSKAIEAIGSGMIIATPTGSTAFALSAGGPVVAPDSHSFVVAPVLPHTLASRPLIVNDDSVIEVEVSRGEEVVFADGKQVTLDDSDCRLRFTRPAEPLKILQKKDWNFYDTLRNKMSWNK